MSDWLYWAHLPPMLLKSRLVSASAKPVWAAIRHLLGVVNTGPLTLQEIADASGLSLNTVRRNVRQLEAQGWLKVKRNPWRGHANVYETTIPF